jgi:hypothetical protein
LGKPLFVGVLPPPFVNRSSFNSATDPRLRRWIALAKEYGYRAVKDFLQREGWAVGKDRMLDMYRSTEPVLSPHGDRSAPAGLAQM